MLDPDWKSMFPAAVLERGLGYYLDSRVCGIRRVQDGWDAFVEGSQDYRVHIADDVFASTCDCPYFEGRGACKHIAAVCFELSVRGGRSDDEANVGQEDARGTGSGSAGGTSSPTDPFEVVDSLGEATLRSYLTSILRSDERWREDFSRRFLEIDEDRLVRDFVRGVTGILWEDASAGFIDYRGALRCESQLSRYVQDFVTPLMNRGAGEVALAIINEFSLMVPEIPIDDSDGFSEVMYDLCESCWQDIYDMFGDDVRTRMFAWMVSHTADVGPEGDEDDADALAEEDFGDYGYDKSGEADLWQLTTSVEHFLLETFASDARFANELQTTADRVIASETEKDEAGARWLVPSRLVTWSRIKIRCMETLGLPSDEIEGFATTCPAALEIVQPLVDKARLEGNAEKAIELLQSLKERAARERRYPTEASIQLLELYETCQREDEARAELCDLVVHGQAKDERQLRGWLANLRDRCGDAWAAYETRLETELGDDTRRLRSLYAESGRLDDLMASLMREGSRYELARYRPDLAERFPEVFLSLYEDDVRTSLFGPPMQRTQYRRMVRLMGEMCEIPGGKSRVARIVEELREAFPRRTALMDELSALEL